MLAASASGMPWSRWRTVVKYVRTVEGELEGCGRCRRGEVVYGPLIFVTATWFIVQDFKWIAGFFRWLGFSLVGASPLALQ